MAYYYPEGYFGPICDALVSEEDIASRSRRAINIEEIGDPVVEVFNGTPEGWYDSVEDIFTDLPPFWIRRNCKERINSTTGEKEYYDCEDEFLGGPLTFTDPWDFKDIGLTDNFFIPSVTPESCSPFDPDVNIRPIIFYQPNGTQITKYKREKSSPPTYPVTSGTNNIQQDSGTLTVVFASDGNSLVVSGTGTGNLLLKLWWNDKTSYAGVAVDTITVGGKTFTRGDGSGGGAQSGEQIDGFEVTPGTYNIAYTGLNAANSPIVLNSTQELCLKDGHNDDCNAKFSIESLTSQDTTTNTDGYWSEDGNKYGVWVNPEVCTLPLQDQTVTYLITIPADDTYGFTFGCDDNGTMFFNDEETAFLTAQGGIFAGGSYNTPYTGTRSLTAGTLKLIVNCTNSAAGFLSNGVPTGLAYSWQRNPGGWYIKICRGGVCPSDSNINWVRSGPHPDWSTFMNTYAVYPSNDDTLSGVTHSGTWNVTILSAGDYNLEVQGDNYCTFSWDGTSLGTIGQNSAPWGSAFTSSTNYTISNASVGNHTLVATVLNGTGNTDWATNPGGVAFQLTSSISATFAANGDLVTTGSGSMEMTFNFVWSDNPNTWSQALGTYAISELGISFTQTSGVQSGAESKTVTVEGGKTYTCTITSNSGGFDRQNTNTKLCFKDLDGSDCNAALTFTTDNVIISSTDLSTPANNNLIWHTRMDTGYEYYTP